MANWMLRAAGIWFAGLAIAELLYLAIEGHWYH